MKDQDWRRQLVCTFDSLLLSLPNHLYWTERIVYSCPCIVYSQNHHRLVSLTATGQRKYSFLSLRFLFLFPRQSNWSLYSHPSTATESTQPVSLWCGLYFLAPQFAGVGQAFLQCFARNQTRSRYAIRGNEIQDLLVGTSHPSFSYEELLSRLGSWSVECEIELGAFCQPCSLVQESREIEEEEEAIRNVGGVTPEAIYRDEEEGQVVAVVAWMSESSWFSCFLLLRFLSSVLLFLSTLNLVVCYRNARCSFPCARLRRSRPLILRKMTAFFFLFPFFPSFFSLHPSNLSRPHSSHFSKSFCHSTLPHKSPPRSLLLSPTSSIKPPIFYQRLTSFIVKQLQLPLSNWTMESPQNDIRRVVRELVETESSVDVSTHFPCFSLTLAENEGAESMKRWKVRVTERR